MHNFEYDPFQKKAIEAIKNHHSVLVSAPTGTGKTAIAEFAIDWAMRRGERVVYTAPIKTISNQKFRDFQKIFPGKVGILTGDVSIEPQAPILIMTTEIYRNQLFETNQKSAEIAWAIFDEVHYLDDYERGTVWEEAIMFSNPMTRFVALSATVPNIRELADWIQSIHQHPVDVIQEAKRPVKLVHYFHCQNIVFKDLQGLKQKGFMGLNTWARSRNQGYRKRGGYRRSHQDQHQMRAKPNRIEDLLQKLIDEDKLPGLYFAFGRKRVEELAQNCTHFNLLSPEDEKLNGEMFDELALKFGLETDKTAGCMRRLVVHGIAYHHAGLLPTLKELVELLFTQKRIQLIFTTETFALGINMPARTVVFDELRKFYGFGFENLTTRDYFQMAGRAGRRGLDKEGFVYSRVNPQMANFEAVKKTVFGETEAIRSQFNASYATLLNLYKQFGKKLFDIYPRSFHFFQSGNKKHKRAKVALERKIELLQTMGYVNDITITPKGEFAMFLYGYELMLSELWDMGILDDLNSRELAILLVALVYEPRKNELAPKLNPQYHFLEKAALTIMRRIHRKEETFHVFPLTEKPCFYLTRAMEAWVSGCQFQQLASHTEVDDGNLIRNFRMVTQLLRQLKVDPGVSPKLKKTIIETMPLINRGIVDAERLLKAA